MLNPVRIILGVLLGLAYGLVSQLINRVALPGIPLHQPPLGAFGNIVASAAVGGLLGYVCLISGLAYFNHEALKFLEFDYHYYFNWLLNIDPSLQLPFVPSHENMRSLDLHKKQAPHLLASNLRRAFSAVRGGGTTPSLTMFRQ